jgi:nucleoside-diphosphate-sugar epimerase
MKILVTGGAGYVGTALIPQLLEDGHHVKVIDNLSYGGDALLPFFRNERFEFILGDIRKREDIKKASSNVDAIIHLAAIVGYPACREQPQLAEEVNVGGTKNLISVLSKDQFVLFASTGSNYGSIDKICTEETPLNPLSLYGQTKTIAENILLQREGTIGFRFATAFGVSGRLRLDLLINDFVHRALKQKYLVVYEKHFMRTFIHVHDMGRAFIFALKNYKKMKNDVYNVGSEEMNYSKEDICEIIKKKIDVYVHYADFEGDEDKRNYVVSYDKIRSLGYQTTISVEEGIDELLRALQVVNFKDPYSNA